MHETNCTITPGAYRFIVDEEHAGLRLDQFLAAAGDQFTRGLAKKVIDLGGVHYDGQRTRRCSLVVSKGKQVEVFVDGLPLQIKPLAEDAILFRDRDLLVINKPAALATQPTPARYQGTLYAMIREMLQNPLRKDLKPSIGMAQRLDRDTSGVIVFSTHQRAHKKLTEQFRNHTVEKRYLALISGHPAQTSGVFTSSLARRRSTNLMVSVEKGGKYAETRYRVVESYPAGCLVEVILITGRSHQIRAHFSEAGLPLMGDQAYGGPMEINGFQFPRQMLHAASLAFQHPVSGHSLRFEAPLPEDFTKATTFLEGSLKGSQG